MAAALEYYGDGAATETVRFLRTFDCFFDCLNTRHSKEGLRKRKPDLFPYVYPTDVRFKVSKYVHTCMFMHTGYYSYDAWCTYCANTMYSSFFMCTVVGGRSIQISE